MRLNALRNALIEGEVSGPAKPFDPAQFVERMRGKQRSRRRRARA
jgi:Arc/MetJ-type ribon-helix-helix transcriptional regulator